MKTIIIFAVALLAADAQVSMHNPFYCYTSDPIRPQYGMHAKQSNYAALRPPMFNPNISSCTPSRFWFLSRHGGCLPKAPAIVVMNDISNGPIQNDVMNNFHSGRASLCHLDFHRIRDWVADPNITTQNAGLLTAPGRILMHELAQRFQKAFPTVLVNTYNRTLFTFRTTSLERSQSSSRAFANGLFGPNASDNVIFDVVPERDTLLRPNTVCPAFSNLTSSTEADAFMDGPEFREAILQINSKLGFTGSNQLSVRIIRTLWDICRYEKNFEENGRTSPWCGAYSIANNQVLDYLEDLEYYYRTGYGVPNRRMTENLNCGLMQNLLRYLQSNDASDQLARVFVTSSSNLQAFFVTLGVFEDDHHLTRHNMAQQMNRQWRSSWITPKGANIAVIRYDCADGDNDVLFLFNERPLQVPGCQSNGLCKVSFILQQYRRHLDADCANTFCTSN